MAGKAITDDEDTNESIDHTERRSLQSREPAIAAAERMVIWRPTEISAAAARFASERNLGRLCSELGEPRLSAAIALRQPARRRSSGRRSIRAGLRV